MKRTDLKVGELYAVRNHNQPCMLLSTDVYADRRDREGRQFSPAPGHKPESGKPWMGERTDYGYLVLNGGEDWLKMLAPGQAILEMLKTERYRDDLLPHHTYPTLIMNLTSLAGPYAEVMAKRRAADDAYRAARQAEADNWNEIAAAFNPLLGDNFMPIVQGASPQHLTLTVEQAKLIADALAAKEV